MPHDPAKARQETVLDVTAQQIARVYAQGLLGAADNAGQLDEVVEAVESLVHDVLERHPYTLELRLTYDIRDPLTGEPDPSAYLRVYSDARQVETTHCYVGRRWQDAIGLFPPPAELVGHRLRMNTFLGKWLEYLGERGHGVATMRPAPELPLPAAAPVVPLQR